MSLAVEVAFEEKNPEDYLSRKRAKEEEEKEKDRSRFHRRSATDRRSVSGVEGARSRVASDLSSPRGKERTPRDRHSYTERNEQVSQAVREYRQKRQSLHSTDSSLPASADSSASSSPREYRRTTSSTDTTSSSRSSSSRTPTVTTHLGAHIPAREIPVSEVVREPPEGKSSVHSELEELGPVPSSRVEAEVSVVKRGSGQKGDGFNGPEQVSADKPGSDVSAKRVVERISSEEEVIVKGGREQVEKVQNQRAKEVKEPPQSPQPSAVDKQKITTVETRTHTDGVQQTIVETTVVAVKQQTRQADPGPQTSVDPGSRSADHAQRSTSPDGVPGISQNRPSSKKTRAPPPPPAGAAVITSSSSSSSSSPPVRQTSVPGAAAASADCSRPAQQQVQQSRAVTVNSAAPPPDQTSPERPTRPKRKKAPSTASSSSSNPSSPRDAPPPQPALQGGAARNQVTSQSPVGTARADSFQLTENVCLEEEAPPAQGTVVTPGKAAHKEKAAGKAPPSSAKNSVPPLLLNTNGQSPPPAQGTTASEPVKQQQKKKGKAPEPPTSSANSSPRDAPLSPSSTPSPSVSSKDAPTLSRSAEISQPETKPPPQEKAERRRSSKSKAPPPPQQQQQPRNNPSPQIAPEPKPLFTVTQNTAPNAKSESSSKVETPAPQVAPAPKKEPEKQTAPREPVLLLQNKSGSGKLPNHAEVPKDPIIPDFPERGRFSETSSINDSDTESIPPPLPNSAPPPLPTLPPPSPLPSTQSLEVEEEVVEVREVSSALSRRPSPGQVSGKRMEEEEGVLLEFDSMLPDNLPDVAEDPQKSMANLRAEFFGLNTASKGNAKGQGDMEDLGAHSGDSDVSSDERGVEGTFSPGDSGVVLSSLPTSPDDGDGRIQLLSYTASSTTTLPASDLHSNHTTTITVNSSSSSSSSRPQSLPVRDSTGDSSFSTSSNNNNNLVSPQDMAALSPRSREIFEKARHFADMVQPPKKEEEEREGGEEFSQTTLQDLELKRRAVISQSTPVRRKEVLSPPPSLSDYHVVEGDAVAVEETVEFREVKETAAPPPELHQSDSPRSQDSGVTEEHGEGVEARWQGKTSDRVNLYSENVVKEGDSSEVVDRESIANLATTRRQWEAIFTTTEPKEEPSPKPKKNPPKWEVRMPYAEKTSAGPDTVSSNNIPSEEEEPESPPAHTHPAPNMADTESAIEREIRLAMEREEMLRREQEQRVRQLSHQAQRAGKASSMESSTESELQPSFHELAEADRGSQFYINDSMHHHQQEEDAEREESLQRGFAHQKLNAASKSDANATESIIEREIRLQREREAELALQRGGRGPPSSAHPEQSAQKQQQQHVPTQQAPEDDDNDDEMEVIIQEIPYEDAISRYNHEGESRIAQELRELKEREEEVRKMRERMVRTSLGGGGDLSPQKPAPASPGVGSAAKSPMAGGAKSTPNTPRVDKTPGPTVSFSRSTPASPRTDSNTASPRTPKPETPIEREIRLARERENELRRAKGLPELKPEPQRQESVEEPSSFQDEVVVMTPRFHTPQPDNMRRFASNRLQQEMLDQKNRELKLRQEGKILSTSEEHIQPHRYSEIVGQDQTDGVVKRNFKTPGRRNSNASQDSAASGDNTPRSQGTTPQTPREGSSSSGKKSKGTGAVSFSYREFAQTAESKIERELREMREREEELRKLRSGGADS